MLAVWCWQVSSPQQAQGYLPDIDTVWSWVTERSLVAERAIITAHTTVFGKSSGEDDLQQEIPSRNWQQTIYWIAGEFLAVETNATDGEQLHLYLREGDQEWQQRLGGKRWSMRDVMPPYLDLLENSPEAWQSHLGFWGVNPHQTLLGNHPQLGYLLLLAENAHKALWLNQKPFRPVRLETRIQGKQGEYALAQHYQNFLLFTNRKLFLPQTAYFPSRVSYTLNGILFKQFEVLSFKMNPPLKDFPMQRLRQEVRNDR